MLFGTVPGVRWYSQTSLSRLFRFQRDRSSGVEVEAAARIDGDIPILGPDFIAERHRINW